VDSVARRAQAGLAALPPPVVAVGAGLAIGAAAAVLLAADSILLLALPFALLAALLPLLVVRDLQAYGIALFLLALPFEASVRVTGRGLDTQAVIDQIGLPPSTFLGIKLFPTDAILAALLLLWALDLLRRRARLELPPLTWLAAAYVGWGALSALVKAAHPSLAFAELVHDGKYLLGFLYFANVLRSRERVESIVRLLLLSLAMEVTVTLVLWSLGYSRDSLADRMGLGVSHEYEFLRSEEQEIEVAENFRASGTFGAASHLAMYLQLLWPLALAMVLASPRLARKAAYAALFAGALLAVYVTRSRSGLVGLAMGGSALVATARWRGFLPNRTVLAAGYAALALGAVLSGPIYTYLTLRPDTFWQRFILLEQGRQLIAADPILGVGPNNSTAARVALAKRHPAVDSESRAIAPNDDLYPVHNQWIVEAAERGLVGLGIGFAFLAAIAAKAWRLSAGADRWTAAVLLAGIASFVALGGHLVGDHFVGNASHTMLWLWCALVVALERLAAEESRAAGSVARVELAA
jgi:O-Antigen ligase